MQTDEYIRSVLKTEYRKDIEARFLRVAAPGSSKIDAECVKGRTAEMVFRLREESLGVGTISIRLSHLRSAISDLV